MVHPSRPKNIPKLHTPEDEVVGDVTMGEVVVVGTNMHTRSLVSVGGATSTSSSSHRVMMAQTRLRTPSQRISSYSFSLHRSRHCPHCELLDPKQGLIKNCESEHWVHGVQPPGPENIPKSQSCSDVEEEVEVIELVVLDDVEVDDEVVEVVETPSGKQIRSDVRVGGAASFSLSAHSVIVAHTLLRTPSH